MAGAAVGVSHLVQSTRAGADRGFQDLIWIVLAMGLKYPFFEIAHRYTFATGNHLLRAYRDLHPGHLAVFLVLQIFSGVLSVAAVTLVGAAILEILFSILGLSASNWSLVILLGSWVYLRRSKFEGFSLLIQVIMFSLTLATLFAVAVALWQLPDPSLFARFDNFVPSLEKARLGFLLALMGWMPAPIELSVWQSLWIRDRKSKLTLGQELFDFQFGYIMTLALALLFLALGALVMKPAGIVFASGASAFAKQFIDLYTDTLGQWTFPLIGTAAFLAMLSTILTLVEAYPRTLVVGAKEFASLSLLHGVSDSQCRGLIALVSALLIVFFSSSFQIFIDFVTMVSFLSSPYLGYLNLRLYKNKWVQERTCPSLWLLVIGWLGVVSLSVLAFTFLGKRYGLF